MTMGELDTTVRPGEARQVLTILAVADLERMVRFYAEGFGWPERARVPVYVELESEAGRGLGLYLATAFAANTGATPAPPPPETATTATELYFYVDDPAAAAERLVRAGGRLLSAAADRVWGDRVAYVRDPEGNVVAVARPPHEDA